MYEKIIFITRNKLILLSNEELALKCLDKNLLIANLAKEELINRSFDYLDLSDEILHAIVNKLSIEQIWSLVSSNKNNNLVNIACLKLNDILEYYKELNIHDYNLKYSDGKSKIYVIK